MLKLQKDVAKFSQEVLNKYFSIEGNVATVDLYFDAFAELIDQNVGNDNVEMLNNVLVDKIDDIFKLIPKKYNIVVNIHVKNFGEYSQKEAEKIIRENVDLKIYALKLERRRKNLTGLSLLGIGAILLLVSYFLGRLDWPQIIYDIINISGTLFVWEAAYVALIERRQEAKHVKQYLKKFKGLHILEG